MYLITLVTKNLVDSMCRIQHVQCQQQFEKKEVLQLLNIPAVRNKLDQFRFLSLLSHIYNYILF